MLGSRSGMGEPRERAEPAHAEEPRAGGGGGGAKKPATKFDDMDDDIPF
jgi:hypothetical protein